MRRHLICLAAISSLALSGCVATAVGAAGAVGVATVQEKSVGTAVDDATSSAEIKGKLLRENRKAYSEVDVEVANNLVLLSGRVDTPEERVRAESIAWSSSRIEDVANEIKIEPVHGFVANTADAITTARVRSALFGSKTVRSVNYNIEVYDGIVYLMGIARSEKEMKHAAEKASYVGGVKQVVSYIRLADDRSKFASPSYQRDNPGAYEAPRGDTGELSGGLY